MSNTMPAPVPPFSRDYKIGLLERLREPEYAVIYIQACARESRQAFLLALRDVVDATGGMTKLAKLSSRSRENLYRALHLGGNPRLDTLWAITKVLGLRITVEAKNAE